MQTSAAASNHKKRLKDPNIEKTKVLVNALSGISPSPEQDQPGLRIKAGDLAPYQGKYSGSTNSSPEAPTTTPVNQGADQDFLTAISGGSRYQTMQNTPEPTRDVELEEKMKRRAKMNLIARGIGSLGQLAGVAAGGDAPRLDDGVTPWIQNQLLTADADYRNNLKNWIERGFQVDMYNNRIKNQEAAEDYDTQVRADQAAQKAEYDAMLAEQKAQAALNALKTKSALEQRKEMQKIGINPDDPKAYDLYLDANRKKFGADMDLINARTNSYNRIRTTGKNQSFDLEAMRKGRDAMIQDVQRELQGLDPDSDTERIKALNDRIKFFQNYNPGSNELIDADILRKAQQIQSGGNSKTDPRQWDPEWYMENQPTVNVKAQESIQKGVQKIMSPDFRNLNQVAQGEIFNQIIQGLLDGGFAASEDEAEQYILELLGEDENE